MAKKTIKAQMKQRRDTKANWEATNPVLLDGELGIVSDDPNLYKVGDGATAWNDLPFRGFDGTLAQELGTSPNAVISQKVASEKLTELESEFGFYDMTGIKEFASKNDARRYAVLELKLNISYGFVLKYKVVSIGDIVEICKTEVASSYDDGWEIVTNVEMLQYWKNAINVIRYNELYNIHNNIFKFYDIDLLKGATKFATKADARKFAILNLNLTLNAGNVIHYTLSDSSVVTEVLCNNIPGSVDSTWIDMADYTGQNKYLGIYNLSKSFDKKTEARKYAVIDLKLSLKVNDILLYFVGDRYVMDVMVGLSNGEVASADEFWVDALEQKNTNTPISFYTDAFLQSCTKTGKYLTKIACVGDSLIANAIGGAIPSELEEGSGKRPMRMLTNGVPRRLYDFLSWNKPEWRRLEHWVSNGFSLFDESGLFEGTSENYWKAESTGAYAELTIPDGMEHFALICRTKSGYGSLKVTLNGGNVGKYKNPYYTDAVASNSVITSDVVPQYIDIGNNIIDLNNGVSATGNPYHIVEFHNLPSGENKIRFTTTSNARCDIWGGFYWHGNTMVVMNLAHGGHTTSDLLGQHLDDELFSERYDAVLFEITEMNNLRLSISKTLEDIQSISERLKNDNVDFCFTSCNPLGISILYDTNFYAEYTSPTMLELNNAVRQYCYSQRLPFIDLFTYFHQNIISRGGTLEGGEVGLWYTHDGQHGNEAGVAMWFNCLVAILANKPLKL